MEMVMSHIYFVIIGAAHISGVDWIQSVLCELAYTKLTFITICLDRSDPWTYLCQGN